MGKNPNSLANLEKGKKTRFKSGEEAANAGRKGGIASGESKQARKTLRAELEALLATKTINPKTGEPQNSTVQEAITAALVKQALKGNTKAYALIRDTIGEKPAEHINLAEIDQSTIDAVEKMVNGHAKRRNPKSSP